MKRKNIKEILKKYFFLNPSVKLRVRQIEKVLCLPLPSVIRYCKELEEEGILKKVKIGNVLFYTSDTINDFYLLEKKLFNLKQIYLSGLLDYLRQTLSNPPIVLFGSYFKGEDREDSDIDLYIETSSKKDLELKKFEKVLQRKIQIFRYKKINEIKNLHLANNILNGITLNNYLEVFK
jgi:predicted nucleotidyltransferase